MNWTDWCPKADYQVFKSQQRKQHDKCKEKYAEITVFEQKNSIRKGFGLLPVLDEVGRDAIVGP